MHGVQQRKTCRHQSFLRWLQRWSGRDVIRLLISALNLQKLPNFYETLSGQVNSGVFNCYEQTVVSAIGQKFHSECFICFECHKPIRSGLFHLENGEPYCDAGMMLLQVVISSLIWYTCFCLFHLSFELFQYTGLKHGGRPAFDLLYHCIFWYSELICWPAFTKLLSVFSGRCLMYQLFYFFFS